jgi:hypothetical protein
MGNPLLRLVLLIAVVLGLGGFIARTWKAKTTEYECQQELERIERDYLERSAWVRQIAEPAKYRDEMRQLLRWYFQELTDHYNKYPGFKNYSRALDELKADLAKHKIKDQEFKMKEEYYNYARAAFDAMKEGRYDPVLTATSNSMRLDILDIRREGAKLRMELVLWGAQRRWMEMSEGGTHIHKLEVNAQFSELSFRFADAKGKIIGEMTANGDPELKVDHPERWIEEFPPMAVLGFYPIDPGPAEADQLDLTISVQSRSATGEEIPAQFTWKVPMKDAWKLQPGQTWEGAQVETRPDEYIDGKQPETKPKRK